MEPIIKDPSSQKVRYISSLRRILSTIFFYLRQKY